MMAIDYLVAKCCVCGKVRLDDEWQYRHIPESEGVEYTHTYCPDDFIEAMRSLEGEIEDEEI